MVESIEVVGAGEAGEDLHVIRRGRVGLGPGDDRTLLDRQRVVGDDEVFVEHQLLAEAIAGGAGALGYVEAEQAWLDLFPANGGNNGIAHEREYLLVQGTRR